MTLSSPGDDCRHRLSSAEDDGTATSLTIGEPRGAGRTSSATTAPHGVEEVVTPTIRPDRRHIFNQYTVRCSRRDELMEFLKRQGVGSEIYYPMPLSLQECFAYLGYKSGDLPVTEQVSRECLSLPIYSELTEEMRRYVVENITDFYR